MGAGSWKSSSSSSGEEEDMEFSETLENILEANREQVEADSPPPLPPKKFVRSISGYGDRYRYTVNCNWGGGGVIVVQPVPKRTQ